MKDPILQSGLPADQRAAAAAPLPKMQPVAGGWITVDDAYAGQVSERARLLATHRDAVLRSEAGVGPVAELYALCLAAVRAHPGFGGDATSVTCPDGRRVVPDADRPWDTLAALMQEDLCLLERRGAEHVLTAALLCFPAGWTLAEKLGQPLSRIHAPVPPYDANIAARVQRFCEGLRPGRPLWRANLHGYRAPDLFAPQREGDPKDKVPPPPPYWRSERQTLLRLPESGAVLFAIHTTVVAGAATERAEEGRIGP